MATSSATSSANSSINSARSMASAGNASPPRAVRQRRWGSWQISTALSLLFLGLILAATVAAPSLAQFEPSQQILHEKLQAPSAAHWLGTDHLGRDLLARLLYGGRSSLILSACAVLLAAIVGVTIGSLSGRIGGLFDEVMMRLVDVLLVFPGIVLALVIAALLKPSFGALLLALTIASWTSYARLARALTLEVMARPYIEAALALGVTERRLLTRHVLPNILGPILAMTFLRFGHTLLTVAGLSYLGVGVQPPTPDWGAMLAEAQPYTQRMPTLLIAPAVVIFLTTLCVTLIGQGLMLYFDPNHRRAMS